MRTAVPFALAALLMLAGCTQTLRTSEPPAGAMQAGASVLVDDGTCPAGQVKRVVRGPSERVRSCVPRPQ